MKLRDLRPCDCCGGNLGLVFHVVRHTQAVADARGVQAAHGEVLMMGSTKLAEVLGTNPDVAVLIADQDGGEWDELILCQTCMDMKAGWLYATIEKRNAQKETSHE